MKVNPFLFGAMALAIFLGTIITAQATGIWSVSGKVTAAGEKVVATGADPDEIKGWMTLREVADAYGVPVEEVLMAFELPADTDPSKQIKEMESERFSPANLRAWLRERMAGG